MDRKLAWVGLNALPSLTPRRLRLLLAALGGPAEVWQAPRAAWARILGDELATRLDRERAQLDPQKEAETAATLGARLVTWEEKGYPPPFKELPDPPLALYVLGELRPEDSRGIAIVGTRRCSSYGRLVAKKLAGELASCGVTVISGLAPGIDTAAHQGALSAGRTVAVLGTGLARPYPAGSERLIRAIAESGAVISEFPLQQSGSQWTFPRRNRLIAGLSLGVVVVEAPLRSGALITADLALEQGKEVFAVPGPITSEASAGTNRLLQEGAKLVTGVEDILGEFFDLGRAVPSPQAELDLDADAQAVYDLLALEPLGLSELVERTGLSHARLSQILVELELAGLVKSTGGRYIRSH
jgi:DNA processing protein